MTSSRAPRRQLRLRAPLGRRGAGVATATNDHPQVDRRRACRMGLPATPRRAKSARQSRRERLRRPPLHLSCRTARARPCRTCSRRRRCRRCDGPTLPPRRSLATPADLQVAAAEPAGKPAAAGRGSAAARGRSDCAHGCGRVAGKADRIVAEAASGDGRRPRAGRPHGKRDRPDRPHAGAPRHPPQAPRDVGFRKDRSGVRRNRCSTTRTPGCGAPEVCTIRAYPRTGRIPQERTRAPQERPRVPQERTRVPQERTTRVPQERPRPPQERDTCPRIACPSLIACPMTGAGAAGYGNAVPARPQRADLTETEAAAIFPAGAAACERTR